MVATSRSVWWLAAGLFGFAVAWVATTPSLSVFLNWDNGAYLHHFASERFGWHHPIWNCHLGIGHFYWLGVRIATLLGGTAMHGFRLANALGFGAAAAILTALTLWLARGERWLSALLAAAWLTCWTTMFLVFSVEDNVLFLPVGAGVLSLCVRRLERWSARDSVITGALGGVAYLVSSQALLYLAPPFYVAVLLGPGRGVLARVRDGLLVLAGAAGTVAAWAVLVAATTPASTAEIFHVTLSYPQPSLFPRSVAELIKILSEPGKTMYALGTGVWRALAPRLGSPSVATFRALGAAVLLVEAAVCAASFLQLRRAEGRRFHLLAATLLLFTGLTALYQSAEIDNPKRFDFLPLVAALLVAAALALRPQVLASARKRAAVAAALVLFIAWNCVVVVRWRHLTIAEPAKPDQSWVKGYYDAPARDGARWRSWYDHLTRIRRAHPRACAYVFTIDEVRAGTWWNEIPALLWSELPTHVVLAEPAARGHWRHPPRMMTKTQYLAQRRTPECAFYSAAARFVLP